MIAKQLWQNEIDKSNLIECNFDTLAEIRDCFDYQWIRVYPGMQDDSDRAMFDSEDNLIGYMESHGKSYIAPHILELPRPPKPEPKEELASKNEYIRKPPMPFVNAKVPPEIFGNEVEMAGFPDFSDSLAKATQVMCVYKIKSKDYLRQPTPPHRPV